MIVKKQNPCFSIIVTKLNIFSILLHDFQYQINNKVHENHTKTFHFYKYLLLIFYAKLHERNALKACLMTWRQIGHFSSQEHILNTIRDVNTGWRWRFLCPYNLCISHEDHRFRTGRWWETKFAPPTPRLLATAWLDFAFAAGVRQSNCHIRLNIFICTYAADHSRNFCHA